MKKSLHSLFTAAIVSVTVLCAHAAETVSEAVVLNVKGDAQASLPGESTSATIKAGDKLPQGTIIETPDGSEVEIQVFSGSTTVIESGSKVNLRKLSLTTEDGAITKQSAVIDLSLGTVVSTLDPSKKSINDYSIKTPKGVAAARGTKYTVTVSSTGQVQTWVTNGMVIFTNPATGQSVSVPPGFVVTIDADGKIGQPVEATSEQRAEGQERQSTPQEHAVDITIVSPSS